MAWDAFIARHTSIVAPALVPELRFHVVTRADELWRADEASLQALGIPYPFWAFCWPGGQALARAVLDGTVPVAGQRVLDLGAGCGIAGIAAARMGAATVHCSEIDGVAVAAIGLNAALNGVGVIPLLEDVVDGDDRRWDVILAADVCYERSDASRLREWLERCALRGTAVFIADPFRGILTLDGLQEMARFNVATDPALEDSAQRETGVFRLISHAPV